MTIRTYTFDKVARRDGHVFVRFVGTKQGVSFDSVSQLRDEVRRACERDRAQQMLMAINAFLKANPVNPDPSLLNGVSFTADDGNG